MKKTYIAPAVEIEEVMIEKGFATSAGDGFNTDDFENDNDGWWSPDEE